MTLFQVLSLAILIPMVTGTIFTSSHKMQNMALQEGRILSKLKDYIDKQQDPSREVIDAYHKLLQESRQKKSTPDVAIDIKHPNGAYYAIKRFSVHYPNILGTSLALVNQKLRLDKDPIKLADNKDFEGSLIALIRLQEIYNLSISDMIAGNYSGHMGPALGYEDVYFVGRIAFTVGKLNISRDWLQRSLELRWRDSATSANPHREPTVGAIKSLMGRVCILLGDHTQANELYREALEDNTNPGDVVALRQELETLPVFDPPQVTETQANYSRLCRYKESFHIESPEYGAMKCRYKPALVPYYVFREEILSISPYVSLFYNVFTDQDRAHLRENVYHTLERGSVVNSPDSAKNIGINSDTRTSDVAWLRDANSPRTALLSSRISLITGLSVQQDPSLPAASQSPQSAESFQIVNYGLAGHYVPHFDPFVTPDPSGFRIATFLIYLNSVDEGGNTVFTKAGISVAAKKDTALFWYSFSPSFDKIDDMTYHAGCPVIVGEKWIANKWIRSHGNDYSRPCGLKPDYNQLDIEKIKTIRQ